MKRTRLYHLRTRAQLTQRQLAAKAQIAQSELCYIEGGRMRATPTQLERLCLALGVPTSTALHDEVTLELVEVPK